MREKENVLDKVKENILKLGLIENDDNVIVGVSGGPDSVFLLYSLHMLKGILGEKYNIKYNLIVCHINHMIREEADDDEKFVEEYAEKLGYKFFCLREDVKKTAKNLKISEEECGRNIRYEFFEKIRREKLGTKVVVAHNANDNAETILFNLLRGTGITGLCGIKNVNGLVIRPLLNIRKEDIVKYLKDNSIEYKEDKTNRECIYTRNKIRNSLIKNLEEYNPNIIDTLNRMSETISIDDSFIEKNVDNVYNSAIKKGKNGNIIDIVELNKQDVAIKNRIIRRALFDILGDIKGISRIHIDDIVFLLELHIRGKKFCIGNKFEIIVKNSKEALIIRQ